MTEEIATGYHYAEVDPSHTHAYLWKSVERLLGPIEPGF